MTRILTRILIVAFAVLRTPLVIDPRAVVAEPEWRIAHGDKPRFVGWFR